MAHHERKERHYENEDKMDIPSRRCVPVQLPERAEKLEPHLVLLKVSHLLRTNSGRQDALKSWQPLRQRIIDMTLF